MNPSILLFLTLFMGTAYADEPTYRMVKLSLHAPTLAKANAIKSALEERISQSDKLARAYKNADIRINSAPGGFQVEAAYSFVSATKAAFVYDYLRNNMPSNVEGKVSIHSCPSDGTFTHWEGCQKDPRAEYEETTF